MNRSSFITSLAAVALTGCAGGPPSDYARLPHPANALTTTVLGDDLYVLGGHHGGAHASAIEDMDDVFLRLDLTDPGATWEHLEAPGEVVQQATIFTYAGEVHRIGGLTSTYTSGEDKDLWTLDRHSVFRDGTWVELEPLPESRASHAIAQIGDRVYVMGGWVIEGDPDDFVYVEEFFWKDLGDPDATWQTEEQPFQVRDVCGGAYGGRAWLLGGMRSGVFPKITRAWDPETGSWSEGPELPSQGGLNGFGCAADANDEALYLTHRNGTVFSLDDDGWEPVGDMRQPRTFHSVSLRGEHELIAVGGSDGDTNGEFDAVESIVLDD